MSALQIIVLWAVGFFALGLGQRLVDLSFARWVDPMIDRCFKGHQPYDPSDSKVKDALMVLNEATLGFDGAIIKAVCGEASKLDAEDAQANLNRACRDFSALFRPKSEKPYSMRTGDLFKR